jgi:phosphohistidine phosphatase
MKRLFLLRHAKAGWAEPGMRDFDRPLDASGRRDAEAMAAAMAGCGLTVDAVLCSTARRARETWAPIAEKIAGPAIGITYSDDLYGHDAAGYLALVRAADEEAHSLLVVGHNPMVEDLAFVLAGDGAEAARATLAAGFPTCGLAVIALPATFAEAAPGKGYLEAFLTPDIRDQFS